MKYLSFFAAIAVLVGCAKGAGELNDAGKTSAENGVLSVCVGFEDRQTRAVDGNVDALPDEMAAKKVTFLVFDKGTGLLSTMKTLTSVTETCTFTLPAGDKTVYAVVNGPDLSGIRSREQMSGLVDDLSSGTMSSDGLTMVGYKDCTVGAQSEPEKIVVYWLVSRVVLKSVTCNILEEHENMTVDCVFLGNANTRQTFGGDSMVMVNLNGRVERDGQNVSVGLDGETGLCESYLFRSVGETVSVNASTTEEYYMYCQPNDSGTHTCLYLLVDIKGGTYYYMVPLNQGLVANTTYSVELTITNLGSSTPPDGDLNKGNITAVVKVAGWIPGNSYVEEF